MSVQAIAWAFSARVEDSTSKLVLVALANYAAPDGLCWPSQKAVAADCCLSDRTVRSALIRLEAAGLLTRTARHRANGTQASDLIRLRLQAEAPSTCQAEAPSGGGGSSFRSQAEAPSALTTLEPSVEEPSLEPQNARAFAVFWSAYPEKVGKRAAEAAYAKAVKRISGPDPPGVILAGVERAKSSDKWRRGIYPNPSTWLNQDRWTDQPANDHRPDHHQPSPKLQHLADIGEAMRAACVPNGRGVGG